jgi:hypothetical protein
MGVFTIGNPKWMIYSWKSFLHGWFGDTYFWKPPYKQTQQTLYSIDSKAAEVSWIPLKPDNYPNILQTPDAHRRHMAWCKCAVAGLSSMYFGVIQMKKAHASHCQRPSLGSRLHAAKDRKRVKCYQLAVAQSSCVALCVCWPSVPVLSAARVRSIFNKWLGLPRDRVVESVDGGCRMPTQCRKCSGKSPASEAL